jgi:acetyl esterase/lipase
MRYPARLLSVSAFVLSGVSLLAPKRGWLRLILFVPKLFVTAFMPLFAVLGLLGLLLSRIGEGDTFSSIAGLLGSAISIRYLVRLVRSRREAVKVIESEGESRVSASPMPQMHVSCRAGLWQVPPEACFQKDIVIGCHTESGKPILADLWQPAERVERSGLGIIYLHGSGWHYADKDFGTRYFFRRLCARGHTILDVAYTLAPEATLLPMLADVKRAVVWLKEHASATFVRADRIVLMGGSAGGHLALLAAYTPNHPEIDADAMASDTSVHGVVSYYGPPDLSSLYHRFMRMPSLTGETARERGFMDYLEARVGFEVIPLHNLIPNLLGGTPEQVPERYRLGSPITHVGNHCPSSLLLQGEHDFSGVAPDVRRLHEALLRAGCWSVYFQLANTEHGFDLYKPRWSPPAQAATYVTERFLASLA